jgi:hypothetical protein
VQLCIVCLSLVTSAPIFSGSSGAADGFSKSVNTLRKYFTGVVIPCGKSLEIVPGQVSIVGPIACSCTILYV